MPGTRESIPSPAEIGRRMRVIRGQRVLLDSDLAEIYGVQVKRLNEQVSRNRERFPSEFAFRLTPREFRRLRSQIATSKGRGGRRHPPRAFTEHGAVMLATVLKSRSAVGMSIQVVRALVLMRRMIGAVSNLARRLDSLERKMVEHDERFALVFDAIRQLMAPEEDGPKGENRLPRPIGVILKPG